MIHSAKDNIWFSIIFNVNGVLPLSDPPLTLPEPDCHPAGKSEQSPPGSTAGPETLSVFNTSTGGKAVAPPPSKYFTALNKMHIQEERLKELPAAPNQQTERIGAGTTAGTAGAWAAALQRVFSPLFSLP